MRGCEQARSLGLARNARPASGSPGGKPSATRPRTPSSPPPSDRQTQAAVERGTHPPTPPNWSSGPRRWACRHRRWAVSEGGFPQGDLGDSVAGKDWRGAPGRGSSSSPSRRSATTTWSGWWSRHWRTCGSPHRWETWWYSRLGITDLFAALNLATGQVIHQLDPSTGR